MKLIKKILAIMFAFMMVVGMGTKVNAEENESTTEPTGKITINNAVNGQTYSIYKILELESFSGDNYSYKPVDAWKEFFQVEDAATGKQKGAGSEYVTIDENGYATWESGADVKTFAKLALEYAKNKPITPVTEKKIENKTLEFTGLEFGYYLVDSSVGALCGLDTTNPNATINEKNGTPTVEKLVKEDSDTFGPSNTADIGQKVEFKTTITAQAGAQNYVLHDKMDAGLTFNNDIQITLNNNIVNNDSYNILLKSNSTTETKPLGNCTFEIDFLETFCNSLKANDQIIVSYSATLNENAVVKGEGNKNETWLKYGNGTDTAHSITTTKTYEIPVFKYTKKDNTKKGLSGAKFTLSKNANDSSPIKLIEVSEETTKLTYRVAKEDETSAATEITTPSKGEFVIQGLDADTYYLTEIEAPKGYNKLAAPIEVVIDGEGNVKFNDANVDRVEVENKTGTLLPSTGGMGTTIIYMAGAILVVASGIVLVSKKRSKAK
mgnify:FL=1